MAEALAVLQGPQAREAFGSVETLLSRSARLQLRGVGRGQAFLFPSAMIVVALARQL